MCHCRAPAVGEASTSAPPPYLPSAPVPRRRSRWHGAPRSSPVVGNTCPYRAFRKRVTVPTIDAPPPDSKESLLLRTNRHARLAATAAALAIGTTPLLFTVGADAVAPATTAPRMADGDKGPIKVDLLAI